MNTFIKTLSAFAKERLDILFIRKIAWPCSSWIKFYFCSAKYLTSHTIGFEADRKAHGLAAWTQIAQIIWITMIYLTTTIWWLLSCPSYRPQRSCGQGNIFTPVCHSVHGGACLRQTPPREQTPPRKQIPPGQAHPPPPRQAHPQAGTPPRAGTPPWQAPPWEGTPWAGTPPRAGTPPGRRGTPPRQVTPPQAGNPQFFFYLFFIFGDIPPPNPRSWLRHMVNERPVRILLECILVTCSFSLFTHYL